jgi:hypothetical protein
VSTKSTGAAASKAVKSLSEETADLLESASTWIGGPRSAKLRELAEKHRAVADGKSTPTDVVDTGTPTE